MLFKQDYSRKLEAKEALEDKMPSETMRLAPRLEPVNPGSPLHGDPHDVPARKLPTMYEKVAVDILKAQVASRDQRIANLSKWYNDSQATIEELKAVVTNLKAEVVYPGSPLHGDPHDTPRTVLVDYTPPGGAKPEDKSREVATLKFEIALLKARLAGRQAEVALLEHQVIALQTTVARFLQPEPAKPSTGEALANAFRADNFSSPYGR